MSITTQKKSKIVVIIVTRNRKRLLKRCLQSLEKHLDSSPVILVVDNASSDGTQDMIKRDYPEAVLIAQPSNLGFGKANNQGIQYIRARHFPADFFLFLNDDAYFEDNSIQSLFAYLEEEKTVKAAIPAVVFENAQYQTGIGGSDLSLKTAFVYFFGLSLLFPRLFKGFFTHQKYFSRKGIIQEMDWASGVCLAVKSDVFQNVPGFPEDYFMYAEDVALGERIRRWGKIIYFPMAKVIHTPKNQKADDNGEINTLWLASLFQYFKTKYDLDSFALRLFCLKLIFLGGFCLRWIGYGISSFFQKDRASAGARMNQGYCRYVFKNLFKYRSE